ncbi:hypothetical protein [Marinicellulosiphila megalodicopiae]|uniref:hypothetical protein n=1 Tax=Marinicellulosiphila megalodicopiae TaxID=2724896 RepID=UPI003BAE5D0C
MKSNRKNAYLIKCLLTLLVGVIALPAVAASWTPWLDRDSPGGSGDYEHLNGFTSKQVCSEPSAIQARLRGSIHIIYDGSLAPDLLASFSPEAGLVCKNNQQQDKRCNDYQVRFFCGSTQLQDSKLKVKSVDTMRLTEDENGLNSVAFVTMTKESLELTEENNFVLDLDSKQVLLFDDGIGKDKEAGDGIFTGLFFEDVKDALATDSKTLELINRIEKPISFEFSSRSVLTKKVFPQMDSVVEKQLKEVTLADGTTAIIVDNSLHSGGILPGVVNEENALIINDVDVIADPAFTYDACNSDGTGNDINPNAPWSFKTLMSQLNASSNTGLTDQEFIVNWLENWLQTNSVNGFSIAARKGVVEYFKDATGNAFSANQDLTNIDIDQLPFRLLAIVNRIDLSKSTAYGQSGQPGEIRFVFGLLNMDQQGGCQSIGLNKLTVIFEYADTADVCTEINARANQWIDLDNIAGINGQNRNTLAFKNALKDITDDVTINGATQLNQLRTNDFAFDGKNVFSPWQLKEFVIDPNTGLITPDTIKQNPDPALFRNGSNLMADYLEQNAGDILCEAHVVPEQYSFQGQSHNFLGAFADYTVGNMWNAPINPNNLPSNFPSCHDTSVTAMASWVNQSALMQSEVRHKFSLNTCDDCHSGETDTNFVHVDPVSRQLSGFLTGISVDDAIMQGDITREFNDLARRNQVLTSLASSQACGIKVLNSFHALQPANIVH